MKRRSKADGQPVKARRREAVRSKGGNVPKAVRRHNSSAAGHEAEIARLTRERDEALEQQTASSEVLSVISRALGDLEPTFNTMLANATTLCEASFGSLFLREGDIFRSAARHMPASADIPMFRQGITFAVKDNPSVPLVRMVDTKSVLHVADLRTDQSYIDGNPRIVRLVEVAGARAFLVD